MTEVAIKETPIIFSTDMVRAILDGRKTQTRRVIKPQPEASDTHDWYWKPGGMLCSDDYFRERAPYHCPYGQVGDLLWVRETFAKRPLPSGGEQIMYKEQFNSIVETLDLNKFAEDMGLPKLRPSWKPSIHMLKQDARIWLEITGIRVERLQEISFRDCEAEGIWIYEDPWKAKGLSVTQCRGRFARLWDSINAKRGYGWSENPWVWVIEFKKVDHANTR